ncbi:MAG: 2-oxo-hepta-3-ene-1,7-dioate hydratase, partial [Rhodoglobus sp.]|nr:2-oxo-hepta-3-ene-1,7-dioate hydratase [Rhodoglobus sp.]
DDAYEIQRAWVGRMLGEGRTIIGRKVGLTSKPMQRAMGIAEPDFGVLTDDMRFEDGGDVSVDLFNYPRVEAELAFELGADLVGPGVTAVDVRAATSRIVPAIEILDSRVEMTDASTGHRRTIVDTVSDNAANAGIIVGTGSIDPATYNPREVSTVLTINNVIEETGVASAVLGDPAEAVAWLANRIAEFGERLHAGESVLSGALMQSIPVQRGDIVHAEFGSLGEVSCRFV